MRPGRFRSGRDQHLRSAGLAIPGFNEAGAFPLRKDPFLKGNDMAVSDASMRPGRFRSGRAAPPRGRRCTAISSFNEAGAFPLRKGAGHSADIRAEMLQLQ